MVLTQAATTSGWRRWACVALSAAALCRVAVGADAAASAHGDLQASLLGCLADHSCIRRLADELAGASDNASNATLSFDLPVQPEFLEFTDADSGIGFGNASAQAGTITLASYADVRGTVIGAKPSGGSDYGLWGVPVVFKVALLAFANGLVLTPPAQRAPVGYRVLWADTCKDPDYLRTKRCSGPYAARIMQPLVLGRTEPYIPPARALFGGFKWTVNVAQLASAQGLLNMGYFSTDTTLSDKYAYPSFVRTVPTQANVFRGLIAVLQRLKFTIIDQVACDTQTNRGDAAYFNDLATGSGLTITTFYLQPTAYMAGPQPGKWEGVVAAMKGFNAHAHVANCYRECATWDAVHYFAMQGLVGAGHFWLGDFSYHDTYEANYVPALTTWYKLVIGYESPFASVVPYNTFVFLDSAATGSSKAAFWQLMDFVGRNQDAYLGELAGLIPQSAFADPSTYNWDSPYTDYLVDAVFAVLYGINDLVLQVGENFTNEQLLSKVLLSNFEGVTGRVRFDANGDRILELQVFQCRYPPNTTKIVDGVRIDYVQVGTYVENLTIQVPLLFRGDPSSGPRLAPPPDRDLACDPGQEYDRESGLCRVCQPGTYTSRSGMAQCEPCVPGSYAPNSNSSSCLPCREGFAAAAAGSTACRACAAGRFNDALQQSDCQQCQIGAASPPGASTCDLCQNGFYAAGKGNANCTACPGVLTTRSVGSTNASQCICPAGWYRDADMREVCHSCPDGMLCELGSDAALLPLVLSGTCAGIGDDCIIPRTAPKYMTRKQEPFRSFLCLYTEACPGGPPGTCGPNHDGDTVACGRCVHGAHKDKEQCVPCKQGVSVLGIILIIAACLIVVLFMAVCGNRDLILQTNSTYLILVVTGTTLSAIQTTGVFRSLALEWFEPLASIFSALLLINFNIEILSLECIYQPNAVTMYLARQLAGPIVVIVLGLLVLGRKVYRPSTDAMVEYSNAVGTIFAALFISMAASCMLPLICYAHPGRSGESMLGDPAVLCWESVDHVYTIVIGGVIFVVVLVPFIASVAYATLKHHTFVAQSVTGNGRGLSAFRYLFYRYHPQSYFYGSVLMFRGLILCLIPVVIRHDAAFQVCATSALLLIAQGLQLQLQPWRSVLANVVDGASTAALILLLVCGSAGANMTANIGSIKMLGTIIFGGLCLSSIVGITIGVARYLRPNPYFQWFICHHKRDAGAQARLLKSILELWKQSAFIDSDDLKDLDQLFDIVKSAVGHLLVYLTREVLTRPWCAGEIATTVRKGTRMTGIYTPSWMPPNEEDIQPDTLPNYLDLSSTSLQQYSISFESVSAAYHHLLSSNTRKISAADNLVGQARFHNIVGQLLARPSVMQAADPLPGCLVISSDPGDDEATASAGILAKFVQTALFSFMGEGVVLLVDGAAPDEQRMQEVVWNARAVVVVLSRQSLESEDQLLVIGCAMERLRRKHQPGELPLPPYEVIPLTTPTFQFPAHDYYGSALARIWQCREDEKDFTVEDMTAALHAFFKRLAVSFSTHASAAVLESQAQHVVERVPKRWQMMGAVESLRTLSGGRVQSTKTGGSGNLEVKSPRREASTSPRREGGASSKSRLEFPADLEVFLPEWQEPLYRTCC